MKKKITDDLNQKHIEILFNDFLKKTSEYFYFFDKHKAIDLNSEVFQKNIFDLSDPLKLFLSLELKYLISNLFKENDHNYNSIDIFNIYSQIEKPRFEFNQDFAFKCFFLAKTLKSSPNDIAKNLQNNISLLKKNIKSPWIKSAESLNGFLNLSINTINLNKFFINYFLFSTNENKNDLNISKSFQDNDDLQYFNYFNILNKCFSFKTNSFDKSKKSVLVEYSQPNTHKQMHIGHLRNICIGSSLVNLKKYLGYNVKAINYIGDEGNHIAKCLWMINKLQAKDTENDHIKKNHAHAHNTSFSKLYNDYYIKAQDYLDKNPQGYEFDQAKKEISKVLKDLEQKTGPYYTLWQETKKLCLADFDAIYNFLNIKFDHNYFESELTEDCQKLVDKYLSKKIFVESQGAIGIDLSDQKLGFMMLRKSDGNSLYITKDLALAYKKLQDFPQSYESLMVVGEEQTHHFKQLFACLKILNFKAYEKLKHIAYGMVTLKHGKMSSRKGNTVSFDQLRQMITEALTKHLVSSSKQDNFYEKSHKQKTDLLNKLIIGTMKYGMLSTDLNHKIIFDPDMWCKFEGQTGPYLMYAYSRSCSLIKKAKSNNIKIKLSSINKFNIDDNNLDYDQIFDKNQNYHEKKLMLSLANYAENLKKAAELNKPQILCTYIYDLAKTFSKFYTECQVIADSPMNNNYNLSNNKLFDYSDIKSFRLILILHFMSILKHALNILGIEPPRSM